MHIETGEKSKHFSYRDYFTYPVSQHGRLGQRCPDNRGCTVDSFRNFYTQTARLNVAARGVAGSVCTNV